MPAAIVPIALKIGGAFGAVFGWKAGLLVAQGVIALASVKGLMLIAALAYSSAQQRKMKRRMAAMRNEGRTFTTREPAASRRVIYGKQRAGGVLVFAHTSGTKREFLYMVIALAGHEVEAIDEIYISDEVETFDGSGNATGRLAGFCRVIKHLGSASQTVGAGTMAVEIPSIWTANHRLRGVACLEIRLKWDVDKYPTGIPNISAIVRGKKLYDPRSTLTAYSDNSALVVRDYLTNTVYGIGASTGEINDTALAAAANICDEPITLADATTEKRYTCNGMVDTATTPDETLSTLLASMAGIATFTAGRWRVLAGAHQASSATITTDDLRGSISLQSASSRRESANGVKGIFLGPDTQYQPADFPQYYKIVTAPNITAGAPCTILSIGTTNFTLIGAASNTVGLTFTATGPGTGTGTVDPYLGYDKGERVWRDIELPFTVTASAAQRLAKIELELARQDITVRLPLKLSGIIVQAGDVVALTIARYGWSGKLFTVEDWSFALEEGSEAPALGIDLVLRETAAEVWDWTTAEQTTFDPAPDTDLPDPWTVAAPTSLTVSSAGYIETDGTWTPRLLLEWTAPDDEFVLSGGLIRVQFKKAADSDWLEWSVLRGNQGEEYLTDVLAGTAYDVRIRAENTLGVASAWVTGSGTPTIRTGTPATPSGGALSNDGVKPNFLPGTKVFLFGTRATWTPNTESDFSHYEIKATNTNSDAATDYSWLIVTTTTSTEFFLYNATLAAGFVRVRAINRSGVASGWAALGNANGFAAIGTGTISTDNKDNTSVSGLKQGLLTASLVRKVLARYQDSATPTLVGGSPTENFTVSLTDRGFSTKPDLGAIQCASNGDLLAAYDFDNVGNSSTAAVVRVVHRAGSNIGAGIERFSVEFIEYD